MLVNPSNGQKINLAPNVRAFDSKGRANAAHIAVLAPLREVLEPETAKCGKMFKMETRARFKQ